MRRAGDGRRAAGREAAREAGAFFRAGAAFRAVFFFARALPRGDDRGARAFFGAALRARRARRAELLRRPAAGFRADPREGFRALAFFRAGGREAFRAPRVFFDFFATSALLSTGSRREPDHTIPGVSRRVAGHGPLEVNLSSKVSRRRSKRQSRVVITARPGGLSIEIRPLAGWRAWRRRLAAGAALVVATTLFGAARLVPLWETSLKRGSFSELPFPLLVFLTLAVVISAPLTLVGLAALAFSEEAVEVDAREVSISTTTFERTRVRRIPLAELDCWRETSVPLPPWWSWSVKRLAARSKGRLYPFAGGAGPKEKRAIGLALARATGRRLIGDFGRVISD